jgi:hypothetical protein
MGYYAAFLIKRSQMRSEMRSFISSEVGAESLQKLVIPLDQYTASVKFIEKQEFIYKGELYDMIRVEKSGNNMILSCINDMKEQLLLNSAKEHFDRNHDQNNSTNKGSSVLKNIIKEACPERISLQAILNFSEYSFKKFTGSLYIPFLAKHTPPPKPTA